MPRPFFALSLRLALLPLFGALFIPAANAEEKSEQVLQPFVFVLHDGVAKSIDHNPGIYLDWLRKALQSIGYELKVESKPVNRAFREVSTQQVDATLGIAHHTAEAYPSLLRIEPEFMNACFAAFTLASLPLPTHQAGLRIGIFPGLDTSHPATLAQWPDSDIYTISRSDNLLKMLQAGRLDFVYIYTAAQSLVEEAGQTTLQRLPNTTTPLPVFIYLHPGHTALVEPLQRALQRFKPSTLSLACR